MIVGIREALRTRGMEVSRVDALAGDVSKRRYYRVYGSFGTRTVCKYPVPFDTRQSARERWEAMCTADPKLRLSFNSDPLAYIETTDWFSRCGIPVPKLYDVNGEQGLMVMEDVGDSSLASADCETSTADIIALYRTVLAYLDILAESTEEAHERDILGCHMKLDHAKLMSELHYLQSGVMRLPEANVSLPPLDELNDELSTLCEIAASGTFVLCHRDYHSRNLFINGKTVYVLDHQDLRLGHRFYDQVSLLWDPYVAVPDTLKEELWGSTESKDHEELRAVAVQRLLKALGTYINVLLNSGPEGFFASARAAVCDLVMLMRADPGSSLQRIDSMLSAVEQRLDVLYARVRG